MSDKQTDTNATPQKKQTKVEDLPDREVTDESAAEVKGGLTATAGTPGLIVPCVRTIKTSGL